MKSYLLILFLLQLLFASSCVDQCEPGGHPDRLCPPDPEDCELHYCDAAMFPYVLFNPGSTWRYTSEQAPDDTVVLTADEKILGRDHIGRSPNNQCERVFLRGPSWTTEEIRTNFWLDISNNTPYRLSLFSGAIWNPSYRSIFIGTANNNFLCSSIDSLIQYVFAYDNSGAKFSNYAASDTVFNDTLSVGSLSYFVQNPDTNYTAAFFLQGVSNRKVDIDSFIVVPGIGLYAFEYCGKHYKLFDYHLN